MRHVHALALTSSLVTGPVKFVAKGELGAEPYTTDHQRARLYAVRQGPVNALAEARPELRDILTRVHVYIDEQGVHVRPVRLRPRRRRVTRRPPQAART